eukprot:355368-Chlamydomonas_euryale.AAC.27
MAMHAGVHAGALGDSKSANRCRSLAAFPQPWFPPFGSCPMPTIPPFPSLNTRSTSLIFERTPSTPAHLRAVAKRKRDAARGDAEARALRAAVGRQQVHPVPRGLPPAGWAVHRMRFRQHTGLPPDMAFGRGVADPRDGLCHGTALSRRCAGWS